MRLNPTPLILAALLLCAAPGRAEDRVWRPKGESAGAPILVKQGQGGGPGIDERGRVTLLRSEPSEVNALAFAAASEAPETHRRWEMRARLHIHKGADGFALLWLPAAAEVPKMPAWEEPNWPGALAIGFDIFEPRGRNPFDATGNIYARPERQVSIHWDGVERANALSPVEFRREADDASVLLEVEVAFVTGGVEVSVRIDGQAVYEAEFIAGVQPYWARPVLGARSGGVSTHLRLAELELRAREAIPPAAAPKTVPAFTKQLFGSGSQRQTTTLTLPPEAAHAGRIVLRYRLDEPPAGWDEWDRSANVYILKGEEEIEIARVITPYARSWSWSIDVTDFRSLLTGEVKLGAYISAWCDAEEGFLLSLDFDIYEGEAGPCEVLNLWTGMPRYGDPKDPISGFFTPREVAIPADATRVRVRLVVTGHGQAPNTGNAAEFLKRKRWLEVGEARFEDLLWRTDCYLNPCRPQGGTWKFDRAGWAPGAVVRPWIIDITDQVTPGETATLRYLAEPYVNEREGGDANHWVASQLLIDRSPGEAGE